MVRVISQALRCRCLLLSVPTQFYPVCPCRNACLCDCLHTCRSSKYCRRSRINNGDIDDNSTEQQCASIISFSIRTHPSCQPVNTTSQHPCYAASHAKYTATQTPTKFNNRR